MNTAIALFERLVGTPPDLPDVPSTVRYVALCLIPAVLGGILIGAAFNALAVPALLAAVAGAAWGLCCWRFANRVCTTPT